MKEQKEALLSRRKDRPPPVPKSGSRCLQLPAYYTVRRDPLRTSRRSFLRTSHEAILPSSHGTPSRQMTVRENVESSKPKDKSKSHKERSQKEKEKEKIHKGKSSSSRDRDPREPNSAKRLRIDPDIEVSSGSDLEEQLVWLEKCETRLANLRAAERDHTSQVLSRPFEASLPWKVPNWFINGRSSVLETHASEDSFELYKHTLLATDQFALTTTDFTRLEELIAHNNFMNNAMLHHMCLRVVSWKTFYDDQRKDLDRLAAEVKRAKSEKEKAINDACSKLAQENSALKTEETEETDEFSELVRSHLATSDRAPGGDEDGAEA
ncbi:hypothetical protein DH2020_010083 [Rehmannia glutinosa]|uniref:Uncharacterized protein n=1 Tax=Rehmannia glutinosa TaxID=99300 RepID=A0ABR0XA70_REHGL